MFSESPLTDISDVPALVAAFAKTVGFSVTGNSIKAPGDDLSYTITTAKVTSKHTVTITEDQNPTTRISDFLLPRLRGTYSVPETSVPTRLILFGSLTPQPYVAGIVEMGFNSYRHFYIGNMEKHGSYTGGNIISANNFPAIGRSRTNSEDQSISSNGVSWLFGGRGHDPEVVENRSGGVLVTHADNPTPWRKFRFGTGYDSIKFKGNEVLGGNGDSIMDQKVGISKSQFSAHTILIPYDLYVPDRAGTDTDIHFRPIGRVPGVRGVNMEDISPGQIITVGSDNWHCYPEFRRSAKKTVKNSIGYYMDEETSQYFGIAYKE